MSRRYQPLLSILHLVLFLRCWAASSSVQSSRCRDLQIPFSIIPPRRRSDPGRMVDHGTKSHILRADCDGRRFFDDSLEKIHDNEYEGIGRKSRDLSHDSEGLYAVVPCSNALNVVSGGAKRKLVNTLLRGSLLRIASDLSGGTPLESIKTRVTITTEGPWLATCNILKERGPFGLYTGTTSRTVEGALIGAVFMLGSVVTKNKLKSFGCPPTVAALAGGLVGGVAQSVVMTPAGMVFTALSAAEKKPGQDSENAISICKRIISEKGIAGLYVGMGPMCLRQASNWASRSGFTEIARSTLGLSKYGLTGELASGIIGGVGSSWNTPIETIRVMSQRDVSIGKIPKSIPEYWNQIVAESGYPGLFRGVTPRAIQAIWQTTFLVVVPNLMGI
jgi:Mitochondrial carrier protein